MAAPTRVDLLPDVQSFLSSRPLPSIIAGKEHPGHRGETFATLDPGTGRKLADVYAMDAQDVDRAVKAADDAFKNTKWAKLPANERGVFLHRLADLIERNAECIEEPAVMGYIDPVDPAGFVQTGVMLDLPAAEGTSAIIKYHGLCRFPCSSRLRNHANFRPRCSEKRMIPHVS